MISFKTFLSEAFDKPYPIRINTTDTPKEFLEERNVKWIYPDK